MLDPRTFKLTIDLKVLCVCEHGNSRSVALGWILKEHFGMNVLCCGTTENLQDEATCTMLLNWADVVILVDERLTSSIPEQFHKKLLICHVGDDTYFRGYDRALLEQYAVFITGRGLAWQYTPKTIME